MQFHVLALTALTALTAALPNASPAAEAEAKLLDARGNCGSGFTITTYGPGNNGCTIDSQGDSNSGKGCNVCVQMGNAASWNLAKTSNCGSVEVSYFHSPNCDGSITKTITYDTGVQACNNIPTDIGDHFSARFVCLQK